MLSSSPALHSFPIRRSPRNSEFRSSRRIVPDSLLSRSPPPSSLSTSTSFSLLPPQPPLFSLYRCYLLAEKISSKFRDNGRRWVSERGRPRRKRPTNATNVTPMTTADRPFELVKRLGHRSANHLSLCRFNRSTARFFNRFTIRRDQLPFFVYTLCRYIYI